MRVRFFPIAAGFCIAGLALVTACGGGGGSSSPVPPVGNPSTPTPISTSGPQSTTTNASGVVVNDANGQPLAGVPVKLMPWGPCGATPAPASITPENDGCPTPLPSPQATTNPTGQFVLNGAPNGHYLLVIGNDTVATPPPGYAPGPAPTPTTVPCPSGQTPPCYAPPMPTPAPFTVQATVHDNVTLTGGNQVLLAPVLPPVPTITPPAWETNGDYRLATLDASTEMPCLIGWQYERAQRGLSMGSVDEWLVENVRDANLADQAQQTAKLVTNAGEQNSGGTDCVNSNVLGAFAGAGTSVYTDDPRTVWFFGQYLFSTGFGLTEFPIDPRWYISPNAPTWP
ncbi:MAG: hypothetical protein HKL91_09305 [Candidatus Eremiobacteraeota bacterium]|nr:hypothetical protein [Candidatus Eremiobacteraeota bacterium]